MSAKRFSFVMEQTLGHVTYTANLQHFLADDPAQVIDWLPISYEQESWPERWPGLSSNWSLRGSLKARQAIRAARRQHGPSDLYFFHTQVVSLLSSGWLDRRIPVVISLDATPINYDKVGAAYGHATGSGPVEKLKYWLNRRAFQKATRLIPWTQWDKRSLIEDYGVSPDRIEVIPAGTDLDFWASPPRHDNGGKLRLLFVGGDFERKGGKLLYESFRQNLSDRYELHIVTKDSVEASPDVHVYHDVRPHSPELQNLFRQADVFALPTQGDCNPHVLLEAMAAGLPVVSTEVGAIPEQLNGGETGFVIPPQDGRALVQTLTRLADDPSLRRQMGAAGRLRAETHYDAARNARRILKLCQDLTTNTPHG